MNDEKIIITDMGASCGNKCLGKPILCLGIESSCDETSAAIVDSNRNILSHEVIKLTLERAGKTINDIDVIAATAGPGLIGGVLVGWMAATGIANATNKPLVAVNHLEGHALVPRLKAASASDSATNVDVEFPYLLMLASGGHCQILLVFIVY